MGRGQLFVDAPADVAIVIDASFAAVHIRDLEGPVRVAAAHARTTILNTTGRVDAIGMVIDFAGSKGEGATAPASMERARGHNGQVQDR